MGTQTTKSQLLTCDRSLRGRAEGLDNPGDTTHHPHQVLIGWLVEKGRDCFASGLVLTSIKWVFLWVPQLSNPSQPSVLRSADAGPLLISIDES